jgi:hypothetical protein
VHEQDEQNRMQEPPLTREEQGVQGWQGPEYAHLRPEPLLPIPERVAAIEVVNADPRLNRMWREAGVKNGLNPEAERAVFLIADRRRRQVAAHQLRAARAVRSSRARRRGAGRPAGRSARRASSSRDGPSDEPEPEPPARVGGQLRAARRRAA